MAKELGKFSLLTSLLNPFIGWGVMAYLLLWFQRNQHRYGSWLANAGVDGFGAYIIHPLGYWCWCLKPLVSSASILG